MMQTSAFLRYPCCRGCAEGSFAVANPVCLPLLLSFQAFVIFCGLGINNTIMYDQVKKSWAKQSVALDVRARKPPSVTFYLLAFLQTLLCRL